jgi:hypothetical protein
MDALQDELEVLSSIYINEEMKIVQTADGAVITCKIDPPDVAFVSATLTVNLPQGYPETSPPVFQIPSSYGIGEEERRDILQCLRVVVDQQVGEPVIFQLIETTKECLERINLRAECQICRCMLRENPPNRILVTLSTPCSAPVVKTVCGHNYHSACLARWWQQKIANSVAAERLRGGEMEESGRERESLAKLRVQENALAAANAEAESVEEMLSSLKLQVDEAAKAAAGVNSASRSGATRADAQRLQAKESSIRSDLRAMEERASSSRASLEHATARHAAAVAALAGAQTSARAAEIRSCDQLVDSIPCPICRSPLHLPDMPFSSEAFVASIQREVSQVDELPPPPPPSASCKDLLSDEVMASVKAVQEMQRKILLARGGQALPNFAEER